MALFPKWPKVPYMSQMLENPTIDAEMMKHLQAQMQNAYANYPVSLQMFGGLQGQGLAASVLGMQAEAPPIKQIPQEEILCATGGLIGYRAWNVKWAGNTIFSLNQVEWVPLEKHVAKCVGCAGECTCGIYAWKPDFKAKCREAATMTRIEGEVWLWGRVLECEFGYRAEFAYPKAFLDSGIQARTMARIYRVPLLPAK